MGQTKAALIEAFKVEHEGLKSGLSELTDAMDRLQQGRDPLPADSLRQSEQFLREAFIPHAEWDELTFYPGVGDLVRRYGDVNAPMLIDHREILSRITDFIAFAGRIEAGERDPALIDRARILAYQIRALVEVHSRKEDEIYCALLSRYVSDGEVFHALAIGDQMGHD